MKYFIVVLIVFAVFFYSFTKKPEGKIAKPTTIEQSFKEYTIDETKLSDTIQGITDKLDAIKYNNTPSQRQKRKEI